MQHEELFCCHSAEWVEEVKNQWKATNNERKSEYDRCAGNDGMHEDSLVEGMKELMPVYCVIGKIPVCQLAL